jgi:hypothetical protein
VKSRAGFDRGSPRRGSGHRNSGVEVREGTVASISPKVASAKIIGARRNRRATAVAIQSPERGDGGEREGRSGLGRVPDPSQRV